MEGHMMANIKMTKSMVSAFIYGKNHCYFIMYRADGRKYEGEWKNGK